MKLALVQAALASPGVMPEATSGVYVWASSGVPDAEVLYIGEAVDLHERTSHEGQWAKKFEANRTIGLNLWDSAGCGLEAVLAHYPERRPIAWPLPQHERKHVQVALIRLAALTGATPPGQGAGWDYGKGKPGTLDDRVCALMRDWFADEAFGLHVDPPATSTV